jgi:hypothetical protein
MTCGSVTDVIVRVRSAHFMLGASAALSLSCSPMTAVVPGDFALIVPPSPVSLLRGGSAMASVTVVPLSGFIGSVGFSVTGLPLGITAKFSPETATAGSILTLGAIGKGVAASGTFPITVHGASGTRSHVADLLITLIEPLSFTVWVTPTNLTLAQGASVDLTVSIIRGGGFDGAVELRVPTLPAGVTGTFASASVTGNTGTLTIHVADSAPVGTGTITVTAESGVLSGRYSITTGLTITPR